MKNLCPLIQHERPVRSSSVVLDPSSISPRTLVAARNLSEDPRLSKRGYSDSHGDILPPSSFDPSSLSLYQSFVKSQLRSLAGKHFKKVPKTEPAKTEPAKTESAKTESAKTESAK